MIVMVVIFFCFPGYRCCGSDVGVDGDYFDGGDDGVACGDGGSERAGVYM